MHNIDTLLQNQRAIYTPGLTQTKGKLNIILYRYLWKYGKVNGNFFMVQLPE